MRWIKKFEASSLRSEVRDDLKEFCEWNLAYLLDDDYKVMITRRDSLPIDNSHHKKGLIIHFYRWHQGDREGFNWVEVENHFIPFLQRLSKEYTLVECIIDLSPTIDYMTGVSSGSTKYIVPLKSLLKGDTTGLPKKRLIERILIIVEEE
jgi:hypothetical protein